MIQPVPHQGIRELLVSHENQYWLLQNISFPTDTSQWAGFDPGQIDAPGTHTADPSTR